MRDRQLILVVIAAVCLAGAPRAQGSADEQSLKVAHESVFSSVTTGNLTFLQAVIHPRALGFFRNSQFLVQLGGDVRSADVMSALVTDLARFVSVPTDTVYRTYGQVGMVGMTAILKAKKEEKQPDRFIRATYSYVSEAGSWKLVSWHGSDTPLEKKK